MKTIQDNGASSDSRNLAQRISADLGLQIIRGQISSGQLLPTENDLSDSLGVSRSVVREAFKLLAAKGMIKAKRRKGTVVCSVEHWNVLDPDILLWMEQSGYSYQILHELMQIRFAIEPEATAIVARQRELTDFSVMARSLAVLEDPDASVADRKQADIDFHLGILEATRNRYFRQMKPLVKTVLVFCGAFADNRKYFDTTLRVDTDQHRAVLTAMLDGRDEEARNLSHAMIARLGDFIETLV